MVAENDTLLAIADGRVTTPSARMWARGLVVSAMFNVALLAGIASMPIKPIAPAVNMAPDMVVTWMSVSPPPAKAVVAESTPKVTKQVTKMAQKRPVMTKPAKAKPVATQSVPVNVPSVYAMAAAQTAKVAMPSVSAVAAAAPVAPTPVQPQSSALTQMAATQDNVVQDARYLKKSPPPYPKRAYDLGQQGQVVLHALVDASGKPKNLKLVDSSGYKLLDQAALVAVKAWEFEPVRQNGSAISAWVRVPVEFIIRS